MFQQENSGKNVGVRSSPLVLLLVDTFMEFSWNLIAFVVVEWRQWHKNVYRSNLLNLVAHSHMIPCKYRGKFFLHQPFVD